MASIIGNATIWPGLKRGGEVAGGSALDIVEQMIRPVEAEPSVHSVGLGAWPNMAGELELDASIMNGRTLEAGAVAAVRGYRHPISIARKVMERLPHVFLVGAGAERFAAEIGAETGELMTDDSRAGFDRWVADTVPVSLRDSWPEVNLAEYAWGALDPERAGGTTCVLVRDDSGDIAAGVSTSGWAWKYPGRVGDSPVIGAGCYADNRYGAVGCIGTGEMAIRTATARSVVLYMKLGMSVEAACREAAADYGDLSGGFLRRVIIHAIDARGDHYVLAAGSDRGEIYYAWDPEAKRFEELESDYLPLGARRG